uniref:Str_synth domain-containing protein n=1 Tax=Rhabditophanes sp. KR3021 TaxID=114890 RepID=A0AC35U690_9BILA
MLTLLKSVFFILTVLSAIVLYYYKVELTDFNAQDMSLPDPPVLDGVYKENNLLVGGDWLLKGRIHGPESLLIEGNIIYTGTGDGKIVKLTTDGQILQEIKVNPAAKDCTTSKSFYECGRPLGIRRLNEKEVIVADASKGIYAVNFESNSIRMIFSADTKVNGKKPRFIDDLTIFDDGKTAYVTDVSTKYGFEDMVKVVMEHQPFGRVIKVNLETGEATEETTGYYFPNGIQRHPDGDSFVVCDYMSANVWRYYVKGKKKGESKLFIDNLPGLPDNIRLSRNGDTFLLGLGSKRSQENPHFFDKLNNGFIARHVRGIMASLLTIEQMVKLDSIQSHPGSLFLELDLDGNVIKSYHDPTGKTVQEVTEIAEDDKYFYIGSFSRDYLLRVPKRK